MRISYDFHIHSALSPCGDEEATPCNIVAMASVKGLDAIAISDHNAIGNVKTAMECGEAFGVTVLPAVECFPITKSWKNFSLPSIFPK